MAKTKVSEWDSTASGNTDITGITINEGCPPSTINNAIRETMAQIKDFQDGSSGDGITNSGTVNITGNLHMDGSSGTSGQYLTSSGSGVTPTWTTLVTFVSGMIMLWSGSSGTIPAGWLLCDGASGTPDLRNRFVVGATSTYAVGATGGSTDAVVVSHTHSFSGSTSTVADHQHIIPIGYIGTYGLGGSFSGGSYGGSSGGNKDRTSLAGGHSHTLTGTNESTGVSGTNANLPPYYALCYIMKA